MEITEPLEEINSPYNIHINKSLKEISEEQVETFELDEL